MRRPLSSFAASLLLSASLSAFAQAPAPSAPPAAPLPAPKAPPSAAVKARASELFEAGAQAYSGGLYLVAAEAFLKSNDLDPSPGLLFSAAQAYRREYLAKPSFGLLKQAITLYRQYLSSDKAPKRREDAMQALATLVPLEARHAAEAGGAGQEGVPAAPRGTRLFLSSTAAGAAVSVDGGAFEPAPRVVKVAAGSHRVMVRALGYFDEQISVQAVEDELVPKQVALRPKPAKISVKGSQGALVSIDGQPRGLVPTSAPIVVEPGSHFVAVTMTGHEPFTTQVEIDKDGAVTLDAVLKPTRQRVGAWAALSVGLAGGVATGVLTGLMLSKQSFASGLKDQRTTGSLTTAELAQYEAAVSARDGFAKAALVTGGLSAAVILTSLGLFAFDKPEVILPSDGGKGAPKGGAPKLDVEVSAVGGAIVIRGVF